MQPREPCHAASTSNDSGIVGDSAAIRALRAAIERVADGNLSVLITGETGTGKELVAEALHARSPRRHGAFVLCDLGATSSTLLESELFGHRRGAFTGADRERQGAFQLAHRGTILLDEIGELDAPSQPRLLRAIERKQVKPVGGEHYEDVDVRVLAATNRDLWRDVQTGRFRADLFHRLSVVTLRVPPLREREGDIARLATCFLRGATEGLADAPHSIAPEALDRLETHHWPGNVRELRNAVERAVSLSPGAWELTADAFDLGSANERARRTSEIEIRTGHTGQAFKTAKERAVARFEWDYLSELMERTGGNVTLAARNAGLARAHLHRLLRKHGLRSE